MEKSRALMDWESGKVRKGHGLNTGKVAELLYLARATFARPQDNPKMPYPRRAGVSAHASP
eukprot:1315695-Rhodomonas_salina.1